MWPHCPQLLWCQVCRIGIFLVRPYLVVTSVWSSGTRWTIHSPSASSLRISSRMSSMGARSGLRVKLRAWTTSSGMVPAVSTEGALGPPRFTSVGDDNVVVLQQLFHDVVEDHVQTLVDRLDHVQDPGHVPDEVELDQGLVVDLPGGGGGVQRLRGQGAAPQVEVL